jgi:hypothetical protein
MNQYKSSIFEKKKSKTNQQTESLRIGFANLNFRVHRSGFVRIQDVQFQIFKVLFCSLVLKICEDL